jgi:large repetitive protein
VGVASTPRVLTITNAGAAPLTIVAVTIGGQNPFDFSVSNGCGAAVPVGGTASCTLTLRFTPQLAGAKSATLSIRSNTAASPQLVQLRGTGITAPPAPAAPDLVAATDTGISATDNITRTTRPRFTIAAAGAAGVTLFIDGVAAPTTAAVLAGTWTVTPVTALADGAHIVRARATNAAGTSPLSAQLTVRIDTAPPAVPVRSLRFSPAQLGPASVPVVVAWSAVDAGSGVAAYTLQRAQGATGAFAAQALPAPGATSLAQQVPVGVLIRYRVRATDFAGNSSAFSPELSRTVTAADEASAAIAYGGAWTSGTLAGAFGGSVRFSGVAGRTAAFTFTGTDVGWVTTRGPNRGIAEVRLDGTLIATIDLYSAALRTRELVLQRGGHAHPRGACHGDPRRPVERRPRRRGRLPPDALGTPTQFMDSRLLTSAGPRPSGARHSASVSLALARGSVSCVCLIQDARRHA